MLSVSNLCVMFNRHRAVDNVSFALGKGECLGLVGESGSGKSTIARAVVGLQPIHSGVIRFDGKDIHTFDTHERRAYCSRVQMVFQDSLGALNPRMTVRQALSECCDIHRSRHSVGDLLELVELPPALMTRYPHELSGGQRQRIVLARALAVHPDLLIADEPVSALDVSVQAQIIHALHRLHKELRLSILFIAHDLAVVSVLCPRACVLHQGRIVEEGKTAEIFRNPKADYTRALLAAVESR